MTVREVITPARTYSQAVNNVCLHSADDLGGTSPLQLLQDDFESSDQEIRLKALKRIKLVADVLGPEATRSELIPFINSE